MLSSSGYVGSSAIRLLRCWKALKAAEAAKLKTGRPCKLSLEDQLLLMLLYWREYRTLFHLGAALGISEGTASRRVRWVDDVLISSGRFAGLRGNLKVVAVDATETPVEQPQKIQRRFYSGKRKRHTVKSEVLIDRHTGRVLATANASGRSHDLRLRRKRGTRLPPEVHAVVDLGYQGLQHEHCLTVLPFKAIKKHPLKPIQRAINCLQARLRILVEHVIRRLKVFWILGSWPDRTAIGAGASACGSTSSPAFTISSRDHARLLQEVY